MKDSPSERSIPEPHSGDSEESESFETRTTEVPMGREELPLADESMFEPEQPEPADIVSLCLCGWLALFDIFLTTNCSTISRLSTN